MNIRAATPNDAAAIAAVYAPYVADTVISFEVTPPAADEIARRMSARPLLPWLVAEDSDRLAGFAYASLHASRAAYRWGVDVSVYLSADQTGRGLGRRLYEALFADVRALGYVAAYAGIALPNAASVGLHEAMGFRLVGVYRAVGYKFDAWHDVGWWELALVDPRPDRPAEPREWAGGAS